MIKTLTAKDVDTIRDALEMRIRNAKRMSEECAHLNERGLVLVFDQIAKDASDLYDRLDEGDGL